MKTVLAIFLCASLAHAVSATEIDSAKLFFDSLEASFKYQHGEIQLDHGIGVLNVPPGFRFLDSHQSEYVIHDLWGNPPDAPTLGMIIPENRGLTNERSWAF